jgi:DMSO/TMAO reductase YedYZ molybdopterin-dependent catalytic subunit
MSKRIYGVLALIAVLLLSIACGGGDAGMDGGEAALSISGSVSSETSWTMSELEAMETVEVDYTDKDGETTTYTGVPINALLEDAGVESGATTITFVASDDYSADAELTEIQACDNCIVGFDDGSLRVVMPEFSGKMQVKNLVEIQVK